MKILEDGTGFKVVTNSATKEVHFDSDEPNNEPKYSLGDRVVFVDSYYKASASTLFKKYVVGVIRIVDTYSAFFGVGEPYYDIYSEEDRTLYEHVPESKITEKLEVGVYHKPKFSCGDMVTFEVVTNVESWAKKQVVGVIHVVDAYGKYFNETQPAYEIYSEDDKMTYRVLESDITSKVVNSTC